MLGQFKLFVESEEEKNVNKIIAKLPQSHQKLLNGYKFKFTPGNTLKGDNDHIGFIHKDKIVVAAPWNYGRCMTTLHEIAHLVYEKLVGKNLRKEWEKLLEKTKDKYKKSLPNSCQNALDQNAEEIFCMVYAAVYSKHPPITYANPEWINFIKERLP